VIIELLECTEGPYNVWCVSLHSVARYEPFFSYKQFLRTELHNSQVVQDEERLFGAIKYAIYHSDYVFCLLCPIVN
jgi:hypothetical protein